MKKFLACVNSYGPAQKCALCFPARIEGDKLGYRGYEADNQNNKKILTLCKSDVHNLMSDLGLPPERCYYCPITENS